MRLSRFFDFLFPVRSDEEIVRELTADSFLAHVLPRPVPYTAPATVALLPFRQKEVRAAIHEAKYHGSERAFSVLGKALGEFVQDLDQLEARVPCLVPVPLSASREKERGFNQTEEIIRASQGEPERLLTRVRNTASQVSLSGEARRRNMEGAFAAAAAIDPSRLYLVVDDVITTGATMQAAIGALTLAGARHILPIALAH